MSYYQAGTITVTNGSPTVNGTATAFLANVKAGDTLVVAGVSAIVSAVPSNTQITLAGNWPGSTATDTSAYQVNHTGEGWHSLVEIHERVTDLITRLETRESAGPVFSLALFTTGTGDDKAVIQDAIDLAAGGTLLIPSGTYNVTIPAGQPFTVPANTKIIGERGAKFHVTVPTTSYVQVFSLTNDNVDVEGLEFDFDVPAGGQAALFFLRASHLTFRHNKINGGMVYSGGAWNHSLYAWQVSGIAGSLQEDWVFEYNEIIDCSHTILKANEVASLQREIRFRNNHVKSFFGFGINSPNGSCDDVLIEGNAFENDLAMAGAEECILLGMASVTNLRITNNHFKGTAQICVHVEEASDQVLIIGNTFNMTACTDLIRFLDNNIAGTRRTPNDIIVSGNVGYVLSSLGAGVNVALDASGMSGAQRLTIVDNHITNVYAGAVIDAAFNEGILVSSNHFDSCGFCIITTYAHPGIKDNYCSRWRSDLGFYAIRCSRGGILGHNIFAGGGTNVFDTDLQAFAVDGWTIVRGPLAHAGGGTTEIESIISAGASDEFSGELIFSFSRGAGTSISIRRYDISLEGSTFTPAAKAPTHEPGALAVSPGWSSGALNLSVFSAEAAQSDLRLEARFKGLWVVT